MHVYFIPNDIYVFGTLTGISETTIGWEKLSPKCNGE